MASYHGKYLRVSRRRPFLWIGIGCSILALVCVGFIVNFLYGAVKADIHRRQTIQTYVLPTPSTPEITVEETTAPEDAATKTTGETTAETTAETTEETTMPTQPPRFPTIDFAGLQEKNGDVVAWLQIPALEVINYPVVQGEDNAYYVSHAWDGEESENGAIFLLLFGSLPAVYYLFDYATTIYSDSLYAGIPALNELIPMALILFYVVFLTAYHHETQQRTRSELQSSAQAALFAQAQKEMDALRQAQMQATIYRHDMRHHLNMVGSFLDAGNPEQALAYIRKTREDMMSISVKRFCENEAVNLICSSFADKADRMEVRLTVNARLPEALSVSDTELCAILSNGLENALHAACLMEDSDRWIELYCGTKRNKLLIEIRNPYGGSIAMEDGLPVTAEAGHGYGCRSIRAIVLQHGGLYTFSPENGIFTLQIVLPLLPV